MGWLIALIEIIAAAALGLFGVRIDTVDACLDVPAETRTVEYVENAGALLWEQAAYSPELPETCLTGDEPPLPEAEPVFLIEI
ncbi:MULTISPECIES: hypothetical protein [Hyphobacterium]|uniref:Uncharacterized protein n=1 Tax=Hyphobacterium vulgare TaxID=1736751 RepID=A0ABV7A0D9_9PROT